ncbi:MAG TPA: peptidase C39 family protein [Pseudomonas sp.]|uniref:peptidase C39 family protein n=1 Tax=Pseudomonas sp. TaxID=306 RepID=UPI002EDAD7C1
MSVLFRFHVAGLQRKWWTLAIIVTLSGCAGTVEPEYKRLPDRVEINSVPFFRGDYYQSAPGALAGMLSAHNVQITPGLMEKPLNLPGGEAKLEQSMPNLAREYGFVVYPLDDSLPALLAQVSAGFPVMVRISEGSVWWKQQRYGVLIGFNQRKRTVVLHVGENRRSLMGFDDFTSAWRSAGSWAVLIQGPRQLPAQVDRERWLKAANELAQAGQEQAAGEAVKAINNVH